LSELAVRRRRAGGEGVYVQPMCVRMGGSEGVSGVMCWRACGGMGVSGGPLASARSHALTKRSLWADDCAMVRWFAVAKSIGIRSSP
jgi:hypothetical protein